MPEPTVGDYASANPQDTCVPAQPNHLREHKLEIPNRQLRLDANDHHAYSNPISDSKAPKNHNHAGRNPRLALGRRNQIDKRPSA